MERSFLGSQLIQDLIVLTFGPKPDISVTVGLESGATLVAHLMGRLREAQENGHPGYSLESPAEELISFAELPVDRCRVSTSEHGGRVLHLRTGGGIWLSFRLDKGDIQQLLKDAVAAPE